MITIQHLISKLAVAHGVDAETIVRAAVADFAYGRSHMGREQALLAATIDAEGDQRVDK